MGVVAFGFARSVLLPGQAFWDTGEFQAVPAVLGTAHPTGYPSYVILGWLATLALAPAGEAALRMNLLAAILLAIAAGLTVVLVRQLTERTSVAVGAGLLLALTPLPWRMGSFADPHTLHLALMAGLLVLLVGWDRRRHAGSPGADRWLVAAAALYGVMLGNHTLTILLAPGIVLFVLAVEPGIRDRPRLLAACAGALLGTTIALYLELPIRAAMGAPLVYGHPDTWDGFWYIVLAEQFRGDLVNPFGDLGRKVGDLVGLAGEQLGILAAAVPAAFLLTAVRRPQFALLTATWLVVTCWFAASYTNAAIDRYYLGPVLIVVAWLGVAAGILVEILAPAAGRAGGPGPAETPGPEDASTWRAGRARLAAGALAAALAASLVLPAALAAPATSAAIDMSGDTRAADWSRWALETMEADAVVVSWWSFSTPLWYRTVVLGERPDVRVVDDRDRLDEELGSVDDVIRANVAARPVYLVRNPEELACPRGDMDPGDRSRTRRASSRSTGSSALGRRHDGPFLQPPPRFRPLRWRHEPRHVGARPRPLLLLPGPQRGGEPRGPRRGGAGRPAGARGSLRDHRRRRRLAGRDPGHRRPPRGRPPGRRPGGPPPTNLGYGAALRSGFRAARYDLVCFTDGDRQFRVADLGRLVARLAGADAPDVVVGYRIRRADPPIRTIYARLYKLANRVWFGLRVRDVDCACKLFRRAALEGVRVESGRRLLLGRAAHQAARRRADARRGGGAPLPADGRLTDGRPPGGDLARGEGLLGPAAPPVVEPGSRTAPGRGDRGGRPRGLTFAAYASGGPSRGPLVPGLGVERVHEVAEDREALLVERLVVVPVALHARRGRGPPPRRRCARPSERREPGHPTAVSRSRRPGPPVSSRIRAWKVSSVSSAITTSRIVAPSSSRTPANRSWVSGRSGASPCSFIAIAFASHGPIQIGRKRRRSRSLRITTCWVESMCTRTLSTAISTMRPAMARLSHARSIEHPSRTVRRSSATGRG